MAFLPAAARRHPRDRLATLRDPIPPGTGWERPPDDPLPPAAVPVDRAPVPANATPCPDAVGDAIESRAPGREPLATCGAAGRLVRRWLPAGVARWRLDPGRPAALILAAVVLLGAVLAGVVVWRTRPVAEPVPALAAAVSDTSETDRADSTELVISVAGLVVHPGLVRLAPGSRVADAVEAAGGPVPGTDLTGVNLARRLTDGEHVVVGPAAPAQAGDTPSGSGGRVDLNTATLADLDALPGIGPVTARRILDWRSAHGRFASVDQLREVDGIGEARFAQLRELVTA